MTNLLIYMYELAVCKYIMKDMYLLERERRISYCVDQNLNETRLKKEGSCFIRDVYADVVVAVVRVQVRESDALLIVQNVVTIVRVFEVRAHVLAAHEAMRDVLVGAVRPLLCHYTRRWLGARRVHELVELVRQRHQQTQLNWQLALRRRG